MNAAPTTIESSGSATTEQVSTAARGTVLNLGGSIFGAIVAFATVGLITNSYGKEGAGAFFAVTAAFTLAANATRLGAETSLTYFVARFRSTDDVDQLRPLLRQAMAPAAALALCIALFGLLMSPTIAGWLTTEEEYRASATTMIRILSLAVPTYALAQAMFGATRGFGTMVPSVLAGQVVRPLTQLVIVACLVWSSVEALWPLAAAWAISGVAAFVFVTRRLLALLANAEEQFDRNTHSDLDSVGREHDQKLAYWNFTAPRAAADVVSSMLERLDIILVTVLLNEASAGLYGAAGRLILAGQLMMIATAQSMAPQLSASFLKGETVDAQRLLRTISGWNVAILWPMFICLAFGAGPALSAFGSDFTEAAPLVVVLAISFLIVTGLGIGDTLLMMAGGSKASLLNHAISLAVLVGSALILISSFGLIGAAWAWALSRVTLRALAVIRVWQTARIHALGPPILWGGAASLAAYVPTGIAVQALTDSSIAAVFAHVVFGTVIFACLLFVLRHRLELSQLALVVRRR